MIVSAALCPSAPLLVPSLGGLCPPLPELRQAAARAVTTMLDADPEVVTVVGPAPATATWPVDAPVDLGPFLGHATVERALPPALAVGATVLRAGGHTGAARFQGVADDASPAACTVLGRELAGRGRVALLVVGSGSACRTEKAPGWFDARAAPFDATVERAVTSGDLDALLELGPDLARTLHADGRAPWQVLAGAARGVATIRVEYTDAPFGVGYLVASLRFTA